MILWGEGTIKQRGLLVTAVAVMSLFLAGADPGLTRNGDHVPYQFIVQVAENEDVEVVARFLARRTGGEITHLYRHALKGFAVRLPPGLGPDALRDLSVVRIEPDRVMTLPDPVTEVHGKTADVSAQATQALPTGVNRVDAEQNPNKGNGMNIAVVDTGIDLTHQDLLVRAGKNCTGRGAPKDGNGHGTHVAGTAAAKNNTIGVVGVAPGATVWAVKVLNNNGSGFLSWVICGVDWVAANAATIHVANMSLGLNGHSDTLQAAVSNAVAAGVTFTVASGNSATDANCCDPASYPKVITVSAIADSDGQPGGLGQATTYGADDTFASFSNFGSPVDLTAPGVSIYSTYKNGGYATMSGTSMASPHAAGAAALYIRTRLLLTSVRPTAADVRAALISAGWPQHDAFTGDPDHTAHLSSLDEPLLRAAGL